MNVRVPGQYYDATVFWAAVPFAFGVAITGRALFVRMPIHRRR
jgi:hypothetical protein